MATHKSDIITAKDSLAVSDKSAFSAIRTNATVLQATAVYTFKGTEQSGDVIELVELPAGAAVIPQKCYVADSNPTSLGVANPYLDLGLAGDARYGKVYSLGFGYSRHFGDETNAPELLAPFEKPTRVTATLSQIGAIPAGGKIAFGINYVINL